MAVVEHLMIIIEPVQPLQVLFNIFIKNYIFKGKKENLGEPIYRSLLILRSAIALTLLAAPQFFYGAQPITLLNLFDLFLY